MNHFDVRLSSQIICGYSLRCVVCGCIIRSSYRSITVFVSWIYNLRIYNTTINLWLCLKSVASVLPLCVFAFYYTMTARHLVESSFLYLRRHNILNQTQAKILNIINWELMMFFWPVIYGITRLGTWLFSLQKTIFLEPKLLKLFLLIIKCTVHAPGFKMFVSN